MTLKEKQKEVKIKPKISHFSNIRQRYIARTLEKIREVYIEFFKSSIFF